mgnify:FL=1
MNNTQLRILSAIVLVAIVVAALYMGITQTLIFLMIAGVICVDELYCNFVKKPRFSIGYFITQTAFVVPFSYMNLIDKSYDLNFVCVNAGVALNIILLGYLFVTKIDSQFFKAGLEKYSPVIALFVLLPFCSLASLLFYGKWVQLIVVILFVNFGMDTGAWFFGKNFGKNKLWPTVSPNKTIEGLLGGALTAGVLGTLAWNYFVSFNGFTYVILFIVLGILSQVGDLIQSKLKRQFEIKDSSSLIPGHGGVYDRIDSLVFVAPFYATFINFLNL